MSNPTAEQKLKQALSFCLDIAEEEYPYQQNNVGAELALRHIMRKARETLADIEGESP